MFLAQIGKSGGNCRCEVLVRSFVKAQINHNAARTPRLLEGVYHSLPIAPDTVSISATGR